MNRYLMILSALALGACTDTGGDDSDSDSGGEIGFFEGDPLIWSVTANCSDGSPDSWTFDFITDGLAGRIDIDAVETGDPNSNRWNETHVLDINTHDLHWDAEGSPTSTTTREEAAAMDPIGDADDDNRPDWGGSGQNFETQAADDADGLVGSWDHWAISMNDVATVGEVTESGATQTTLWDCTFNNHTAGAGGSIAFKATMYNDASPPAAVDCVIWGYQASGPNSTFAGDGCVCVDPDAGDCAD